MKHHSHNKLACGNHLTKTGFTPIGTKREFAEVAAKRLKRKATKTEKILRQRLAMEIPFVFDFQVAISEFIADFSSITHQIIIEVDGASHLTMAGQARDIVRNDYLTNRGFTVLRFTNEQVESDIRSVIDAIKQAVASVDQVKLAKRINKRIAQKDPNAILSQAPKDGSRYSQAQMLALKRKHGKFRQNDMNKLGIKWPPARGWLQRYLNGLDPNVP